ncbi:uncharacterized protein LOC108928023 [Scleropages formosus]|uniref:uncharacterized protein LOC108928023 n=1 Tax=Scleropages formosus TaxID=113540 RepID=UPI0010FAAFCB|nr:uncharacterized protein LOC108928023 [Scleropages formosus]
MRLRSLRTAHEHSHTHTHTHTLYATLLGRTARLVAFAVRVPRRASWVSRVRQNPSATRRVRPAESRCRKPHLPGSALQRASACEVRDRRDSADLPEDDGEEQHASGKGHPAAVRCSTERFLKAETQTRQGAQNQGPHWGHVKRILEGLELTPTVLVQGSLQRGSMLTRSSELKGCQRSLVILPVLLPSPDTCLPGLRTSTGRCCLSSGPKDLTVFIVQNFPSPPFGVLSHGTFPVLFQVLHAPLRSDPSVGLRRVVTVIRCNTTLGDDL